MTAHHPDRLETAENAILDTAAAMVDIPHDHPNPIARSALRKAREALMTASNSLHLARIADGMTAKATGHRIVPPSHGIAAL